ncbi:MAG: gliding motility-associated C-terminal domain-containing protein [Candidatus Latescibacteria bacterium]|nr:gliding motility-associated C-terminal domain-containing protein [Candidatus Latescibacterota bacterium]
MKRIVVQKVLMVLVIVQISLTATGPASGKVAVWVVGNDQNLWKNLIDPAQSEVVDVTSDPGWVQPVRLDTTENISLRLGTPYRKGWISSDAGELTITGELLNAFDGDRNTATVSGITWRGELKFWLDLGAGFGVDRFRFYPREGFEKRFVRGYRIYVNDGNAPPLPRGVAGLIASGPLNEWIPEVSWKLVVENKENVDLIDIGESIPPQYVRYIHFVILNTVNRPEIAEFEVYGRGYVPYAKYTSKVIDVGKVAEFGNLVWSVQVDPEASLVLRTRSGRTSDPFMYYQLTGVGPTGQTRLVDQNGNGTAQDEYDNLREEMKGSIVLDTKNWSFWSAPYNISSGREAMLSPGPRRYFQFQLEFRSPSPWRGVRVDSLGLEYAIPPLARQVMAEISPQVVSLGVVITFRYAVKADLEIGNTGFDALEVRTPVEVDSIRDLKIGGGKVEDFSTDVQADRFTISFPKNRIDVSGVVLEVTFDCTVLVHGTRFEGKIFDSRGTGLGQAVLPGDASPDLTTNDIQVLQALGGNLIASVDVSPNPVTPNADGVNDVLNISYEVLQVTEPRPVEVDIYDLPGVLVWRHRVYRTNGIYTVSWDGREEGGALVRPGMYIYRILLESDDQVYTRSGVVVVVY